jgi:hypothetical protein
MVIDKVVGSVKKNILGTWLSTHPINSAQFGLVAASSKVYAHGTFVFGSKAAQPWVVLSEYKLSMKWAPRNRFNARPKVEPPVLGMWTK